MSSSSSPGGCWGRCRARPTRPPSDAYLTAIGEPSTTYAVDGIVHPAHLLGAANRVLTANVVLPAWLHVESEIRHLRAVSRR